MAKWFLSIIVFLLLIALVSPAGGQQIIDRTFGPGDYDNPAFWAGGDIPNTSSESARFNLLGFYDVFFDFSFTVSDLLVDNGSITFSTSGSAIDRNYTITDDAIISGGDLWLDRGAVSSDVNFLISDRLEVNDGSILRVFDGATVDVGNFFNVGTGAGDGTVFIDGNSQLTGPNITDIGTGGNTGTVYFQNGSTGNELGSLDIAESSSGNTERLSQRFYRRESHHR